MSFKCVPIYGLMFRILTRFHAFYFGASCIHRNSSVWRRASILTWKAEAKDFAVLVFNENAHFQWIWSDNFWSRDSAPPMAVGEKHRLYNNLIYEIEIFHSINRKTWVIFLSRVLHLLSEISLFHKFIYDIAPGSFFIGWDVAVRLWRHR